MVDYYVAYRVTAECIVAILYISASESQVPYYYVMRIDLGGLGANTDSVTRCGLASDGYVRIGDRKHFVQSEGTGSRSRLSFWQSLQV